MNRLVVAAASAAVFLPVAYWALSTAASVFAQVGTALTLR